VKEFFYRLFPSIRNRLSW